jgi:hypothetical protein
MDPGFRRGDESPHAITFGKHYILEILADNYVLFIDLRIFAGIPDSQGTFV